MPNQHDVADARRAVDALAAAVDRLRGSRRDTIDLLRLAEDVRRVRVDLDLIAGPDRTVAAGAAPLVREEGYDPREFVDGSYEGPTWS